MNTRVWLFSAFAIFLMTPQAICKTDKEDASPDLFREPLTQCTSLTDKETRLFCFDREVRKFLDHFEVKTSAVDASTDSNRSDQTKNKKGKSMQPSVEKAEKTEKTEKTEKSYPKLAGDFAPLKKERRKLPDKLSVQLVFIEKNKSGKWIVRTSDQQVWRQTDNQKIRLRQGQQAEITKGSFGSFFLKTENQNKRIRVKRIL